MLYKNTKVKVHSLDGDTDYFGIVAGVLQGDVLASYLFIICLDDVLRTSIDIMEDNDFKRAKERSRRYHAPLQHNLQRAAAGIGLHVHADSRAVQIICEDIRRYLLVNSKFQSFGSATDVANVTFAKKLIDEVTFQINDSD